MTREGVTEKVTFEQRLEGGEKGCWEHRGGSELAHPERNCGVGGGRVTTGYTKDPNSVWGELRKASPVLQEHLRTHQGSLTLGGRMGGFLEEVMPENH